MSDWNEMLRSFSKLCGGGNEDVAAAIDAALAEIDRLQAELDAAVRQRDEQATIVNHLLRKKTP